MSILQMIPGVGSLDDAARGELGNLSDDRSKFKDGKYDIGDRLRGLLGGYSEEDVRERAAQIRKKDIENLDSVRKARVAIQENLPGASEATTALRNDETENQYKDRLAADASRGQATSAYSAVKGADLSLIKNLSTQEIKRLASAQQHANEQALVDKSDKRYTDALVRDAQIRADDRRDRREDRAMERELRMMELDQKSKNKKAELFQALFGLGSAFMI